MLTKFFKREIIGLAGTCIFLATVLFWIWPILFAGSSTRISFEKIYFSFAYDHAYGHVTGFETLKVFQTSPLSSRREYPVSRFPHQLDEKQPANSTVKRIPGKFRRRGIFYLSKQPRFSKIEYEKSNKATGITFALKNMQLIEFWREPTIIVTYNIGDVLELYIHPDDDRIVSHPPNFIDYIRAIGWLGSILAVILVVRFFRNSGKRERNEA